MFKDDKSDWCSKALSKHKAYIIFDSGGVRGVYKYNQLMNKIGITFAKNEGGWWYIEDLF